MRKITLFTLVLGVFFTLSVQSQTKNRRPIDDQYNFVPGKIIVKLKDEVDTKTVYNALGKGTAQVNVAELLGIGKKVKSSNVLFTEKAIKRSIQWKQKKQFDYKIKDPKTLKNIFLLELKNQNENIFDLLETIKKNDKVDYAEPNYNYSVNDFTVDSDIIYNPVKSFMGTNTVTPDDPLYTEQSNIAAVKIDKVWNDYGTGDGSQVIAILDTGIDYTHPDLEANIWINEAELNGVDGFDDDGNGYIDDVRGWDFINIDNAPLDDNMHGTHVAGIAGAVGGNGIGIAGAVWNVKLMPIKVFQSNGVGNASTIAEGVAYASENGATILNMSFGSYAESSTLRIALENAYATSVLVAAAGNDGVCIGPGLTCAPSYPAAYTYVLGVQEIALWSNYDQDGPIFSRYTNLLNYESKAPGTGIMSTVPNGGYRALTGTSMASPLLVGGIALYLQEKPNDSKELLFGNLINTAGAYVDFEKAITIEPTPELKVLSAIIKDTINGQNGNDFLEPGETIEILPLVKNYWGPTDDVRVGIEFAEFEDQTKATILESEIAIGSITAYATLQDLTKSLKIKIAEDVANNVNITFNLMVWAGPDKNYLSKTEYVINVKNSILLFGVMDEDMTLTADKEYLVSDNLVVSKNATLTILSGTVVKISDQTKISVIDDARILAVGSNNSLIKFVAENNYWSGIDFKSNSLNVFEYVEIKNIAPIGYPYPDAYSSLLQGARNVTFDNCKFVDNLATSFIFNAVGENFSITNSNIISNVLSMFTISEIFFTNENNNYINNYYFPNGFTVHTLHHGFALGSTINYNEINIFNNLPLNILGFDSTAIWGNKPLSFTAKVGDGGSSIALLSYLGTSDPDKYRLSVRDALNFNLASGVADLSQVPTQPHEGTHGIVWKILVNGKDAQDEYDQMDPVGVGTHEFKVYFNRQMDTNINPQISYGVREPYNQKIISEDGSWSSDGKIYTVNHEVKIGAADGINRIRVQGARDLDYFEIPIEDSRFNMLVQSAGSASAGFAAEPGLGKITLNWNVPDDTLLSDVLGYNMYRYKKLTDTTFTEVAKINESLITDPSFQDYNVEEGNQYFYKYKILRTSLEETDFSQTVTSQPLTSKLGDSNGDDTVNVMDLVQNVDYILGNNPQPFIFNAGDVNDDDTINVLDIVGIVDIILNPSADKVVSNTNRTPNYYSTEPVGDATFFWEGDDLYVESEHDITGIQLALDKDFTYQPAQGLPKFEWLTYLQDDEKVLMLYSFADLRISKGKTKLLTKNSDSNKEFDIEKAVVGTTNGRQLNPLYEERSVLGINSPEQGNQTKIFTIGPNPTSGLLNIFYYLPEQMDKVRMTAFDVQGKLVWHNDGFKNTAGQSSTQVNLTGLQTGVYFLSIDVIRAGQIQKREVKRILIQK